MKVLMYLMYVLIFDSASENFGTPGRGGGEIILLRKEFTGAKSKKNREV